MNNRPYTVSHLVAGALKHAKQELRRRQTTRFGLQANGRRVADAELDQAIRCKRVPPERIAELEDQRRKLAIIKSQIDEFTNCPTKRELIKRRLFDGESIDKLAEELRFNYSTARAIIARAKKYLGIE